jgi:hypothetical protein
MKKQLLFTMSMAAFLQVSLFAQKARFGIQAGPTMSNVVAKFGDVNSTSDFKVGFTAGFLIDKPINAHFIFQPALNFVQKGSSTSDGDYSSTMTLNYIEVPLNFLYRAQAAKGFFGGIGPSIGVGISGQSKDGTEKETIHFGPDEEDVKRMDLGGNLVAGYLFGNGLQVAGNFNKSFSNMVNGEDASDIKLKNNYFSIRVSYFFNGKK